MTDEAQAKLPLKPTSADIRAALKLRYEPASHALLFEVADSTGAAGKRYADAVAVGLWPSHGHRIEGIEVKVSRSDFLNEMKAPEKSQAVFQFCHRWWLACPKGMVKPEELPPTWGLLELHESGTLRERVKAMMLTPIAPTMGFIASLVRRHAGADEDMRRAIVQREVELQTKAIRERLDREAQRTRFDSVEQAKRGLEVLAAIKAQTGLDLTAYNAGDELLAAIKMAQQLAGNYGPLYNLREACKRVEQVIDDLPK